MAQNTANTDEAQVESTLVFDVEKYRDYEPYERVAEGIHERGRRKVEMFYELDYEGEETMLRVHTKYYLDGELKNESQAGYGRRTSYPVQDGQVMHTDTGQELEEFIEANFMADPEVSVGDEFESMVEVA